MEGEVSGDEGGKKRAEAVMDGGGEIGVEQSS